MKHTWISNAAFARITGIKKVCMDCGQPSNSADRVCPGKRMSEMANEAIMAGRRGPAEEVVAAARALATDWAGDDEIGRIFDRLAKALYQLDLAEAQRIMTQTTPESEGGIRHVCTMPDD